MLPLSLAVLPWGILFGSLAVQRGFSWLEAQLFSGIIFGGAVQIVTVELIADNASMLTVLFSAFIISSRHFLYGLTLSERLSPQPLRWRLGLPCPVIGAPTNPDSDSTMLWALGAVFTSPGTCGPLSALLPVPHCLTLPSWVWTSPLPRPLLL